MIVSKVLKIGLFLVAVGLSGCASLLSNKNVEKEWQCPAEKGNVCKSIAASRSLVARPGLAAAPSYLGGTPSTSQSNAPLWARDEIIKIHLASYVDEFENYHEDNVIYSVVRHGGWKIDGKQVR